MPVEATAVTKGRERHFRDLCRGAGLKFTPQRMAIFRQITTSCCHPTAEAVWKGLRGKMPGLSRDTVYRTLDTLGRLGVVMRLPLDANSVHFDGNTEEHHHLVCRRCARIEDLYWPALARIKPPSEVASWGRIERKTIQFNGICKGCLSETQSKAKPRRRASHCV